jgi:hypothetical protein
VLCKKEENDGDKVQSTAGTRRDADDKKSSHILCSSDPVLVILE